MKRTCRYCGEQHNRNAEYCKACRHESVGDLFSCFGLIMFVLILCRFLYDIIK